MSTTQSMDEIFTEMEGKFRADKAAGMNATFQFDITGDDGGTWNAVIADGSATFSKGEADSPTVTITSSDEDWSKITSGQLNPQMAFMTRKIKVTGDIGLATKLGTLFL